MPLDENTRDIIRAYCVIDLPGDLSHHVSLFGFIADVELQKRLGRAFYSARYVAKLMEATFASSDEIHPFVKFQIMQYASIYEAVISYLLWSRYLDHEEVKALQTHKAYKPVNALGSATSMVFESEKFGAEEVFTCVYRNYKTRRNDISFPDKVDCAVRIGFVEGVYSEEIKQIYQLRNLAHIETEAQKQIEVDINQAKNGYWRMKPFIDRIVTKIAKENNLAPDRLNSGDQ